MAAFKIVGLLAVIQAVNSKPLLFHEVELKKNFEFSLKPIKLRPIEFIKETWSPFGHFVKKHAMQKRSPLEISPIVMPVKHEKIPPVAKVYLEKSFEALPLISPILSPPKGSELENELHVVPPELVPIGHLPYLEEEHDDQLLPLAGLPNSPVLPPPPGLVKAEVQKGFVPSPPIGILTPKLVPPMRELPGPVPPVHVPPVPLPTAHEPRVPVPPVHVTPMPVPPVGVPPVPSPLVPVPPVPVAPVFVKPMPSVHATSLPPPVLVNQAKIPTLVKEPLVGIKEGNVPPVVSMFTDIARVEEINSYLKTVGGIPVKPLEENVVPVAPGNSIEPEAPKNAPVDALNSSALVKGSRLALYFGNIFLQVMSEVISSARSVISQYSNKPATM